MVSINTASGQHGQLQAALEHGVNAIAVRQIVTFTKYTALAVSQDDYLFWVAGAEILQVLGSLHYSTEMRQDEDQTAGENMVIFTAEQEITEFNTLDPGTLWIATWPLSDGANLMIAFSRRGAQFGPANLWHYFGIAVLPALRSQLIASAADLPAGPIVSNSLPIWLTQNSAAPVYASFLVPPNVVPPYITAHVEPDATMALQGFPRYIWPGVPMSPTALQPMASQQLARDKVRLTLYGFNNQSAIQYLASLIGYSLATDDFGFCNSPIIRDDKRTQREIVALAMKKTIDIDASYYQSTSDAIARRMILSSIVDTTMQG